MEHKLSSTRHVSHASGDPAAEFARWQAETAGKSGLLLVDFSIRAHWTAEKRQQALTAIYCIGRDSSVCFSVIDKALVCGEPDPEVQYALWLKQHKLARIVVGDALPLQPVFIPKPWGREIWYTGVEQRGVCNIASSHGETPIPWVQAAMPKRSIGPASEPLILLKILDPSAKPVLGDLYFELHEEKREVYVVTHVDPEAWPGGTGYIRYGFSAEKLAQYPDSDDFRRRYLESVQNYEQVRRALDEPAAGNNGAPISEREVLVATEQQLRSAMDSFTHLRPLQVGDVVKVPLLTPHSLQHGVRTIEFQTPVYERKILSFAQQVVTQNHWDTAEAVRQMALHAPPDEPFTILRDDAEVLIERIVDFDDFEVQRVRMASSAVLQAAAPNGYHVLMVVDGTVEIDGVNYAPEQALILPRGWAGEVTSTEELGRVSFLLAIPRQTAVES